MEVKKSLQETEETNTVSKNFVLPLGLYEFTS